MIKNKRQLSVAREKLAELQTGLDELNRDRERYEAIIFEFRKASFNDLISNISTEIIEYEKISKGDLASISISSIHDLHKLLIGGRLALNLTQESLAERVGIAAQQVQRYESTDYESANLSRIREIAYALEIDFSIGNVFLEKEFDFALPDNLSEGDIDNYSDVIHSEGAFLF